GFGGPGAERLDPGDRLVPGEAFQPAGERDAEPGQGPVLAAGGRLLDLHAGVEQRVHGPAVPGFIEVFPDRLGHGAADPRRFLEFGQIGAEDRVEGAEVVGELAGRDGAHAGDAEGDEEAVQLDAPGAGDGRVQLLRGAVADVGERFQVLRLQAEEVRGVADEPLLHERLGELGAEAADVERLPGCEVHEPGAELGRAAEGVRAVRQRAALLDRRAAGWAAGGHAERSAAAPAGFGDALDDLGDDVARALDAHAVPHAHVPAPDLLPVVQGGPGYGHAAHVHAPEQGDAGDEAGPADLHGDHLDRGLLVARLELEGEGPARVPAGRAEGAARLEGVDLDHDAVDLVLEGVPRRGPVLVVSEDLVHVRGRDDRLRRAEAPVAEGVQHLAVGRELGAAEVHDLVDLDFEPALRGDPGVQLAEGTGGRVARVRERLASGLDELAVQRLERRDRHEDLA